MASTIGNKSVCILFFSKLLLFFQILPSLKLLMELQKWEEESERARLSLGQSPQGVCRSLPGSLSAHCFAQFEVCYVLGFVLLFCFECAQALPLDILAPGKCWSNFFGVSDNTKLCQLSSDGLKTICCISSMSLLSLSNLAASSFSKVYFPISV